MWRKIAHVDSAFLLSSLVDSIGDDATTTPFPDCLTPSVFRPVASHARSPSAPGQQIRIREHGFPTASLLRHFVRGHRRTTRHSIRNLTLPGTRDRCFHPAWRSRARMTRPLRRTPSANRIWVARHEADRTSCWRGLRSCVPPPARHAPVQVSRHWVGSTAGLLDNELSNRRLWDVRASGVG